MGERVIKTLFIYAGAALAEIGGCFAFWIWLRSGKSALWVLPGIVSLIVFAWLLTLIDSEYAGRAYAAYGGIYVVASIGWLWLLEGARPDRWDVTGAAVILVGAAIILFGARAARAHRGCLFQRAYFGRLIPAGRNML